MSDQQAKIDPGNEFSKPKPHSLEWILDFVRRHPGASTCVGEADLLVAEIDRLRAELDRQTLKSLFAWARRERKAAERRAAREQESTT